VAPGTLDNTIILALFNRVLQIKPNYSCTSYHRIWKIIVLLWSLEKLHSSSLLHIFKSYLIEDTIRLH